MGTGSDPYLTAHQQKLTHNLRKNRKTGVNPLNFFLNVKNSGILLTSQEGDLP
jgi:hypothetical protein